ncbi:MAG: tetratricopeptide repeat protein [Deltaproteobacteria bacterium]|nr:tetratricopeptide repeat protein [Deltaproteobacteria bacterium]MCX7953488.1 tetratricopeptide repeat protein [Deltaproteobacteria bacterium]
MREFLKQTEFFSLQFKILLFTFFACLSEPTCKELLTKAIEKLSKAPDKLEETKIYEDLVQKCPSVPEPFYNLGVLKLSEKKFDEAYGFFEQAQKIGNSDRYILGALVAASKLKDHGKFEKFWRLASDKLKKDFFSYISDPQDANFVFTFYEPNLGCQFLRIAFQAGLDSHIQSAIDDCGEPLLKSVYTVFLQRRKDNSVSKEQLSKITFTDLTLLNEFELTRLLEILVEAEEFFQAEVVWRKISKEQTSSTFQCLGAFIYSGLGKMEQARLIFEGIACDTLQCFDLCARSAFKVGDFQKSRELIETAIEKYGQNAKLLNFLGVIHRSLGNSKEARSLFSKALEIDPNLEEAKHNLGLK